MKNKLIFLSIAFIALVQTLPAQTKAAGIPQAPFSKGINFSEWFEPRTNLEKKNFSVEYVDFTQYTEQDFIDVKRMGVDVIRLPIWFVEMSSGAPNYTIDPILLKFIDKAVSWAEKHELYIIIDNHSFDLIKPTSNNIDKLLIPLWTQIAQRYKDRSEYVVYEIKNEPYGISDSLWGRIQGKVIDTIRKYDQKHWIIVGGTFFNSIDKLSALPKYSDKKLIYTFHFYLPYLFTHQGMDSSVPSLKDLIGVPFPYDKSRMPKTPDSLKGTSRERELNEWYEKESSFQYLNALFDKAAAFAKQRNAPVFCGEFGATFHCLPEDRLRWYEFVVDALDKRGISRTIWEYHYHFGIFNSNSENENEHLFGFGDVHYDLNVNLAKALGFTPPVQRIRRPETIREGFTIYDDYPNREFVRVRLWADLGFTLLDTNAAEGEFAIRWGNLPQYWSLRFQFDTKKDLSVLASNGYFLEFKARAEVPVSFDIRFVNPENTSSRPWRVRYTINPANLPPDGKWHTIRVPLAQMREEGAWLESTQQWLNPRGEFSWRNIDRLEFALEHENFINKYVWLDSIKITR
ncbi:MAG: glycoside hydrolase family 5 protein [Treponema sp.]|nr:glycoside hydrolase family 5 protein [Treponema sp.]